MNSAGTARVGHGWRPYEILDRASVCAIAGWEGLGDRLKAMARDGIRESRRSRVSSGRPLQAAHKPARRWAAAHPAAIEMQCKDGAAGTRHRVRHAGLMAPNVHALVQFSGHQTVTIKYTKEGMSMSRPESATIQMAQLAAQTNARSEAFRPQWQAAVSRPAPLILRPTPKRRCCKTCAGLGCIGRCQF